MTYFKLNIHKPLTTAEISEAEQALTKTLQKRCVFLILSFIGGVSHFWNATHLEGDAQAFGAFLCCFLLSMFLLVLVAIEDGISEFNPVSDSDCTELMDACMKTAEGQAYRESVLSQGRQFIVADACIIKEWVAKHEKNVGCKELYGIPVDNG